MARQHRHREHRPAWMLRSLLPQLLQPLRWTSLPVVTPTTICRSDRTGPEGACLWNEGERQENLKGSCISGNAQNAGAFFMYAPFASDGGGVGCLSRRRMNSPAFSEKYDAGCTPVRCWSYSSTTGVVPGCRQRSAFTKQRSLHSHFTGK